MHVYHIIAVVIKTKKIKNMFTQFKKICMCKCLIGIAYWKLIVSPLLKCMVSIWLKCMVSVWLQHIVSIWLKGMAKAYC